MQSFYILWKYFTVWQPELYTTCSEICLPTVHRHSNWNTLTLYYKLRLIKLLHSVFIGEAPTALSYLTNKPCTAYNFRRSNNIIVPRFNSQFLKNSISYRGAILWNVVSSHFTDQFSFFFIAKWRRTLILRNLILAHSRSSRCPSTIRILNAFSYFYVLNAVVNLLRGN